MQLLICCILNFEPKPSARLCQDCDDHYFWAVVCRHIGFHCWKLRLLDDVVVLGLIWFDGSIVLGLQLGNGTPKRLRRHKDHKGCGLDKELRVSMDRPGSPKCDRLTSSPTMLGKSKIEPTEFPDCKALLVDQNSCPSWNETWNMKPRKCPVWGFSTAISKRSIWAAAKPSKPAVRHSVYCTAILGGWEITMGYDKPWFSPIYWVYIYIYIYIYICMYIYTYIYIWLYGTILDSTSPEFITNQQGFSMF